MLPRPILTTKKPNSRRLFVKAIKELEVRLNQFLEEVDSSNLTQREKKGILLEFAVQKALSLLNLNHQSNPSNPRDWKKSPGNGVDHRVADKRALIEDKNLGRKSSYYPSFFRRGVSSRFQKIDPEHKEMWVHVVSKADGYPSKVWALCKRLAIKVISVGFVVTPDEKNILKAIRALVKKFMLIFRIRKTEILNKIEGVLKGFISRDYFYLDEPAFYSSKSTLRIFEARKPPPAMKKPLWCLETRLSGVMAPVNSSKPVSCGGVLCV